MTIGPYTIIKAFKANLNYSPVDQGKVRRNTDKTPEITETNLKIPFGPSFSGEIRLTNLQVMEIDKTSMVQFLVSPL